MSIVEEGKIGKTLTTLKRRREGLGGNRGDGRGGGIQSQQKSEKSGVGNTGITVRESGGKHPVPRD